MLLVLIWLPLIGLLEQITRAVSPSGEGLALAEQLAYEVPRQVANVHLIVNLTTVLILLPFTNLLAALIVRVTGEPAAAERRRPGAGVEHRCSSRCRRWPSMPRVAKCCAWASGSPISSTPAVPAILDGKHAGH